MRIRDPFSLFPLMRTVNLLGTWLVFQERVIPCINKVQCKSWMAMLGITSYFATLLKVTMTRT